MSGLFEFVELAGVFGAVGPHKGAGAEEGGDARGGEGLSRFGFAPPTPVGALKPAGFFGQRAWVCDQPRVFSVLGGAGHAADGIEPGQKIGINLVECEAYCPIFGLCFDDRSAVLITTTRYFIGLSFR